MKEKFTMKTRKKQEISTNQVFKMNKRDMRQTDNLFAVFSVQ